MGIKTLFDSARRANLSAIDRRADRRLGIDAAAKHVLQASNEQRNNPYDSLSHRALEQLTGRMAPGRQDIIYDIGCGKGRMICFFAQLNIARCVGIELDSVLARAATRNVARLRGGRDKVTVIEGDAADQDYSDASIVVMNNPFGAEVMRAVLARLTASLRSNPRRLRIYYCGPAQLRVLSDFPAFTLTEAFSLPYDLGRVVVLTFEAAASPHQDSIR